MFLYLYIQEIFIPTGRAFPLEFAEMAGICCFVVVVVVCLFVFPAGINSSAKLFFHVSIHQIFDE